MKKILMNKFLWEITLYIISLLISLGLSVLIVMALLKYILS